MADIVVSPAPPPVKAAAERHRCESVLAAAAFAARRGIRIDAEAAIRRGVSGADLSRDAFALLAERDEALGSITAFAPVVAGTLPGEDPYRAPGASREVWKRVYGRMGR